MGNLSATTQKHITKEGHDISTVEGIKAAMRVMKEKEARRYTSKEGEPTAFYYAANDEVFDVYPILKCLGYYHPEEAADLLNNAVRDLTIYYTEGDGGAPNSGGTILMLLHDLMQAYMTGGGLFTFPRFKREVHQS